MRPCAIKPTKPLASPVFWTAVVGFLSGGCVLPEVPARLKKLPSERIAGDSIARVHRLAAWKMATPEGLEGILREFDTRIDDVAIDSVRRLLYVQFNEAPQFLAERQGICVFDLTERAFVKHIAFPRYQDNDGGMQQCPTWKGTVFDFERQRCYVNAWMNKRLGVACVDIEGASTRLIHRELRLARWPVLDERRLLLTSSEVSGPQAVAFLDLDGLKVDGPYFLPETDSVGAVRGGCGDWIVTQKCDTREVFVYRRRHGAVGPASRIKGVLESALVSSRIVGPEVKPWLVAVMEGQLPRARDMSAATVFSLPELKPLAVLEGYGIPPEGLTYPGQTAVPDWVSIPGTSLLAAYLWGTRASIVVFDATNGHRVARFGLRQAPVDRYETIAFPFTDQQGLYIGSFGGYWIQAFGVAVEEPNVLVPG